MKKLITILLLLVPLFSFSQASKLFAPQSTPLNVASPYFVIVNLVDTPVGGGNIYRLYVVQPDSLKWKFGQMPWLLDTMNNRYAQLLGAYTNPAFVNSLSAAKVFGLSSVALTGNYSDLSGLPNLSLYYLNSNPSGYISGINSGLVTAALGYVPQPQLNGTGFVKATGTTIGYDNSIYLTSVPAQSFSSLTGKPTTLSGYGITDAKPLSYQPDSSIYQTVYRADTMRTRINTSLNGKEPTVTAGTTAQYYRGDKTWQTLPVAKRIEQYSGVTNASGQYAVTFPVAFSVAPVVQPSIPNQSATNMFFRVTSVSTTGFTVNIFQRASLNVLGLDLIAAATTNVASQAIDVSVFEK